MKPLDPRLLVYARSTRGTLAWGAVLGVTQTLATVWFSWLTASVVTDAVAGVSPADLAGRIGLLVIAVMIRAAVIWASDSVAARGAAHAKSELRRAVIAAVHERGPAWIARTNSARTATLLGRGIDALDGYFGRYLPQLILTALATPIIVIAIGAADLLSAIIVIVTLPLIPLFMILIGWATQKAQKRQWDTLNTLSSSFVDSVGGLSTLKIFGRENRLVDRIRRVTNDYRIHTMKVLRVSFLSSFALELAASLSVALVAVTIGLRLVDGQVTFFAALFVLLLAPEAFLPIRTVGVNFHAAAEGVAAAEDVFTVLERPADEVGRAAAVVERSAPSSSATSPVLRLEHVRVQVDDHDRYLAPVSIELTPGEVVVVEGPSGSGKSSLFAAINGFRNFQGDLRAPERAKIAWSPQRPSLVSGTVADNISLGASGPLDRALLRRAMALAAAEDIDPSTELGERGTGLSGGQAQRVAVARAFYRTLSTDGELLLLDEPSSALDTTTERRLLAGIRHIASTGVAVVVISHRIGVIGVADQLVTVSLLDDAAITSAPAGRTVSP